MAYQRKTSRQRVKMWQADKRSSGLSDFKLLKDFKKILLKLGPC